MKTVSNAHFKRRLFVIITIFIVLQGLIAVRLYYWQFVNAQQFISQGIKEQSFKESIDSSRGIIQTSDGVMLAVNNVTYNAYIYLPLITNLSNTLNEISDATGIKLNSIQSNVNQNQSQGAQYFTVISGLSSDKANKLQSLNINGITLQKQDQRIYPNNQLLAQVLGFLGYDQYGNLKGEYGLEQYYNGDLSGQDGEVTGQVEVSAGGASKFNQNINVIPSQQGRNLTLTIDSGIQQMVENELKIGVENTKSRMGTAILMDPKTGAIISMATYPTFNPNQYAQGALVDCNLLQFQGDAQCNPTGSNSNTPLPGANDAGNSLSVYDNAAVSFLYEPGSVMKLVTAAAALGTNKIQPNTIIDATPTFVEANGQKVYNWNKEPLGKATMGDILKASSNVGASLVADMVGSKELYSYMKAFGFGSSTGIDLAGEESGTVPDYTSWLKINLYTASFGQYFGATPLQVASMVSTIANNGVRMRPYIVKSLSDATGTITIKPRVVSKVMDPKVAQELTNMMIETTTGEPAYGLSPIKQYIPLIASKTGSAQVPLKDRQGFDPSTINATYVGFAPANNPKFVLLVALQYPQTGLFAATTAVPVWESIAKNLFVDYNIQPTM